MSQRRASILKVARAVGATWRMSGAARRYLETEDPGLCRILNELSDLTKEEPRGHTDMQERPPIRGEPAPEA